MRLVTNDSAVQVLFDEQLRTIARELVKTVRANVTIDWTVREHVRANLRVHVKRRHAPVWLSAGKPRESDADAACAGGSVGKGVGGVSARVSAGVLSIPA